MPKTLKNYTVLDRLGLVVRIKEHESSIHEKFKIGYTACTLEKVAVDFSKRKIRGTCFISPMGKNEKGEWSLEKPEKRVEWFSFDDPNLIVEVQQCKQNQQ